MKSLGARWTIRCPRRGGSAPAFLQIDQCIQLQHLGGACLSTAHALWNFVELNTPLQNEMNPNTKCPTGASQAVLVVKNLPTNAGDKRHGFNPGVKKMLWRRAWQPTPIFLPGNFHGQKSLAGYSSYIRLQRVEHDWSNLTCLHACTISN